MLLLLPLLLLHLVSSKKRSEINNCNNNHVIVYNSIQQQQRRRRRLTYLLSPLQSRMGTANVQMNKSLPPVPLYHDTERGCSSETGCPNEASHCPPGVDKKKLPRSRKITVPTEKGRSPVATTSTSGRLSLSAEEPVQGLAACLLESSDSVKQLARLPLSDKSPTNPHHRIEHMNSHQHSNIIKCVDHIRANTNHNQLLRMASIRLTLAVGATKQQQQQQQ